MLVTNQTGNDYWFGPLHLPAGVGQTLTVDDTSDTSLYLTDDTVADAINNLYNSGQITVMGAADPFPRPTGTPTLVHGDGSPEGLLYAPQGSLYMRRDATGGAVLYAKTTGITFNTGWQVYSFQATPIQVVELADWPPASPTDGQQAILRLPASYDPIGAKKISWAFVYDAAAAQWDFAGGPPLVSTVDTDEQRNNGSYGDLTTVGPSLSLPRAGDYDIEVKAWIDPGGSGAVAYQAYVSFALGATTPSDNDAAIFGNGQPGYNVTTTSGPRRKTGLSATTVTAKYKTANNVTFGMRTLSILPVRIT